MQKNHSDTPQYVLLFRMSVRASFRGMAFADLPSEEKAVSPFSPASAGVLRRNTPHSTASAQVKSATRSMAQRQPNKPERAFSGQEARNMPPVPRERKSPVHKGCSLLGNQERMTLSAGTKIMATPVPVSTRPAAPMDTVEAEAKRKVPAAARARNTMTVRRAPHRSARIPAGICMAAYG